MASPTTENVPLNTAPYFFPWLERNRARLDRGDAPLNFDIPGPLRVGIGRTIKTGEQFGRQLGTRALLEPQRVREDTGYRLRHTPMLRFDAAGKQAFAVGGGAGIMSRCGRNEAQSLTDTSWAPPRPHNLKIVDAGLPFSALRVSTTSVPLLTSSS